MNTKIDGGPAFPWLHTEGHGGMSLRDYFAAAALQGMLAGLPDESPYNSDVLAFNAYEISDAMLAERDK